jgi:squalene-associated FAD-dependent desaturase
VLNSRTRVPGTKLRDYLSFAALGRGAKGDATVAALLADGPLYRRLLEPLAVAALNTRPEQGLARLLARVLAETLMRGGAACIPSFPRLGLSESFIDPAIAWLRGRGAVLHLGRRVSALRVEAGRVAALETTDGPATLAADDAAVMAVPPWVAAALLPDLRVPDRFESILNIHFVADAPPGGSGFLGLVGGTAEWVFVKPGIVSVTVSAANHLVDLSAEQIAERVWPDVRAAFALPEPMPPVRVVKERRATFAATAEQERRRPGIRCGLANLALAGDWTATGLPATMEGAIRSGRAAAAALLAA